MQEALKEIMTKVNPGEINVYFGNLELVDPNSEELQAG